MSDRRVTTIRGNIEISGPTETLSLQIEGQLRGGERLLKTLSTLLRQSSSVEVVRTSEKKKPDHNEVKKRYHRYRKTFDPLFALYSEDEEAPRNAIRAINRIRKIGIRTPDQLADYQGELSKIKGLGGPQLLPVAQDLRERAQRQIMFEDLGLLSGIEDLSC